MSSVQYDLFVADLDRQFAAWLDSPSGISIAQEAIRRARLLRQRGFEHYGIKAILESIRFDFDIHGSPASGGLHEDYYVNNNYSSRLARYIMGAVPDLAGFFSTRVLPSRSERPPRRSVLVLHAQTRSFA